ncbi:glycosyltransferase [Clostridium cochlearium]|uniref:glycosyltransferase n=1 Tax=Clostridium cochlearium TaxID=1494 RepID=UPI000BBCB40C|nr:glycosyltransferase [Clostridium cochlearium]
MSNARDLILSWFRCYNSIVDDFIYFIDEDEKNYYKPNDELSPFVHELSSFTNIEKEEIIGHIYININNYNYSKIIYLLFQNNNFRYFNYIGEYCFYNKTSKSLISKTYIYKDNLYNFELSSNIYETVDLDIKVNPKVCIDREYILLLEENIYFIKYILTELYKHRNDCQVNNYLIQLFKQIAEKLNLNQREKILDEVIEYIDNKEKTFEEKIYMLSLCVLLKSERTVLSEKIIEILNNDKDNLIFHFHMTYNIFAFQWNDNLELSNKVYIGIRKEIIKLGELFKKQAKIKVNEKTSVNDKNRIAIHYDQLLSLQHAPTILALKMAKNLKKYCKDCEVKIFAEDNFIVNSDEVIFPYGYSSVESLRCREIHKECLKNYNVEVYYSNPAKSKLERTKEIVEEINKFDPTVIYSTSDVSLAREVLYPYYPIVYQTHGGTNFSTLCDAYVLYGNSQKEKLLEINNDIKLIDENKIYINEQPCSYRKKFKESYKKINLGLKEDTFVMVTVGNRLNAEVSDEFVDLIAPFIIEKDNVAWILVGPKDIPYITQKYKDLINEKKIIKINYEEDLLSLYKICDVYINPVRNGGAGSVSIAMQGGVPSIVEKTSQDSVFAIGEENCVDNDKEAYIYELTKLYEDKDYKKYKSELMKKIISNKESWKSCIEKYLNIFCLAKENYYKRINN